MTFITVFAIATAACEFWERMREPLIQLLQAVGS